MVPDGLAPGPGATGGCWGGKTQLSAARGPAEAGGSRGRAARATGRAPPDGRRLPPPAELPGGLEPRQHHVQRHPGLHVGSGGGLSRPPSPLPRQGWPRSGPPWPLQASVCPLPCQLSVCGLEHLHRSVRAGRSDSARGPHGLGGAGPARRPLDGGLPAGFRSAGSRRPVELFSTPTVVLLRHVASSALARRMKTRQVSKSRVRLLAGAGGPCPGSPRGWSGARARHVLH